LYYNKFTLSTNILNKKLNKPLLKLLSRQKKIKQNTERSPNTILFSKGAAMKQMYNFRSNEKSFLTTGDVKSNKVKVPKDLSFNR